MGRTPAERLADAALVICPAMSGGCLTALAVAVGTSSHAAAAVVVAVLGMVLDVYALVALNRLIRARCADARADEFTALVNRRAPTE